MAKGIYSVTKINEYIEGLFKDDYILRDLSISGEVSNCKYNHTGHIYFTLKDETASISCVMFSGNKLSGLKFPMKDGDKVVVSGYVSVYKVTGQYQLYAKKIELAGIGDLYLKFEKLKAELEEKGMFDPMYKQPIPSYATKIGIVTAPTGAAVHDIIRVTKTRNPYVSLLLYPAQVQGTGAAETIARGIELLDEQGLDVIIVGRGGGSIEDLWAFNEEIVAMAIFNARTPIISAVGHETDFTIADFVADKRAATPSQAAEIASFEYSKFESDLDRFYDRLSQSMDFRLSNLTSRLENYKAKLLKNSPKNRLTLETQRLENLESRLSTAMAKKLDFSTNKLAVLAERLDGLSPAKKLASGFGYVEASDGKRLDSVHSLKTGDEFSVTLSDGKIKGKVLDIK